MKDCGQAQLAYQPKLGEKPLVTAVTQASKNSVPAQGTLTPQGVKLPPKGSTAPPKQVVNLDWPKL